MRAILMRAGALAVALAVTAVLSADVLAQDDGEWGSIKGSIVYDAKEKLPDNPAVDVTADKAFCLGKGKIFKDEWVVDPKSRGVKWALVWLTDASDGRGAKLAWPGKIHPSLAKAPKTLVLDQPVCTFIPRMIGVREETEVIYKNSAQVPHNVKIDGGDLGPVINTLIPVGKQLDPVTFPVRSLPVPYSCTIHPWMKGYLGSFKHPYFTVTNEKGEFEIKNVPPGKFRLMVWQEGYGFVQVSKVNRGRIVNVEAKKTTEMKPIEIKKED